MPLSFWRDTVTRIRGTVRTKNGAQYVDWNEPDELIITNVQVVAQPTTRDFDGRILNISDRRTLRAAYDADVQAGDRIRWQDNLYEVEGEVFHTISPTGNASSTRCSLVRWQG